MTVKMPRIGQDDFVIVEHSMSEFGCTYIPLNLTGYGTDPMEAYGSMLSVIRNHLVRQAKTAV